MACPDEDEVCQWLGLGHSYHWWNGSRSCGRNRRKWIEKFPEAMKKFGLPVDPDWIDHLHEINAADQMDGEDATLTNVWIAIHYAVQSGIYQAYGSDRIEPSAHKPHFFHGETRLQWNHMKAMRALMEKKTKPVMRMGGDGSFILVQVPDYDPV